MARFPAAAPVAPLDGIERSRDKVAMTITADSGTRQRIREKFSKLIWDQVRPFAYLDTDGVEVRAFDGSLLCYPNCAAPGAREILWGNYIEPFLEELCRTETAAISDLLILKESRADFIDGIVRTYWLMADIHRTHWPRPFAVRRDTSDDVARMVVFLDGCIAGRAG
jgi:hypothetical protein